MKLIVKCFFFGYFLEDLKVFKDKKMDSLINNLVENKAEIVREFSPLENVLKSELLKVHLPKININ
jgi:hypothetical protein